MKTLIATTFAALLAAWSSAFALDKYNQNNSAGGVHIGPPVWTETTRPAPDQAQIDRCKMAAADDPSCVGALYE